MSTERTLVAHFSKGGAAAGYARIVAETLRGRGLDVDLVDMHTDRAPDLEPYANVVVGTGVRVGVVYRLGKRLLRRGELKKKKVAVFLASGIAVEDAERARRRFLAPLMRRFDLHPVMFDAFPGNLPGDRGQLEDHTDANRAREWASELADRLASART